MERILLPHEVGREYFMLIPRLNNVGFCFNYRVTQKVLFDTENMIYL